MEKIKRALEISIERYNLWASIKGKNYDVIKSYPELRGIFFNKFLTEIREAGIIVKVSPWEKVLIPEDFICHFSSQAMLTNLLMTNSAGIHGTRGTIIDNINIALKTISINLLPTSFDFRVKEIVHEIKSYKL